MLICVAAPAGAGVLLQAVISQMQDVVLFGEKCGNVHGGINMGGMGMIFYQAGAQLLVVCTVAFCFACLHLLIVCVSC